MTEWVCTHHAAGSSATEACGYELASQTGAGYSFPTECPRCGGDLEKR